MANPTLMDKLRQAIASRARQVAPPQTVEVARPRPASGDLYVLGTAEDAAVEWLVVREHPDDPNLILLAPADDFSLAGASDEILPVEVIGRPLVVRCGESCWVPAAACPERLRVGTLSEEAVRLVRRHLAAVARGESMAGDSGQDDADPDYVAWMELVARSREGVQRREDDRAADEGTLILVGQFSPTPPSDWAPKPQLSLAAKSSGPLLAALDSALAAAEPRFQELDVQGSRLLLAADADGVRVAWTGQNGSGPPPLTAQGLVGQVEANWMPGAEPGRFRADTCFPWVDGQVAVTIGTEPHQLLTIRL